MKPSHPLCFRCCRHHDAMRGCPDDTRTDPNVTGLWLVLFAIPALILLAGLISHCHR